MIGKHEELQQSVQEVYVKVNRSLKVLLESDSNVEREDTCKGLLQIIDELKTILDKVNNRRL